MRKSFWFWTLVAIALGRADRALGDRVCADSSFVTVTFASAHDRVTVVPNGTGDSFASLGIGIRVYLKNCNGDPLVGVPRQEIVIFNSALCICPGGCAADMDTGLDGSSTFSGALRAGGCVENLTIFADGIAIGTIPVKTSSPDHIPGSPCYVDATDFSSFPFIIGRPDRYSVCKTMTIPEVPP